MINGRNAALIIIGLFVTVVVLIVSIVVLALHGTAIPPTLVSAVQTLLGVIVGALALNTRGSGTPPGSKDKGASTS